MKFSYFCPAQSPGKNKLIDVIKILFYWCLRAIFYCNLKALWPWRARTMTVSDTQGGNSYSNDDTSNIFWHPGPIKEITTNWNLFQNWPRTIFTFPYEWFFEFLLLFWKRNGADFLENFDIHSWLSNKWRRNELQKPIR